MDSLLVSLTLKKQENETIFSLVEEATGFSLKPIGPFESNEFHLIADAENGSFQFSDTIVIGETFEDQERVVKEKLANLYREWQENQNIGFDVSTGVTYDNVVEKTGYDRDNIYVENKPFSIWQLINYIDKKTLIVNPDFQRNFIWDKGRQSRLIESILLGLPLPAIYLSQFDDGTLAVVDGLQRISSIHAFMKDELRLCNLEYLTDCEGYTYSELEGKVSSLVYRMFDQTTIMCFVIDRRSPYQLKYDLFKRLNTGGVPLNNQEIRNCLSKEPLQKALKRMVESKTFLTATSYSINNYRMDAQELALRFMYFYDEYSSDKTIGQYNGNLESALNRKVELLNRVTDFEEYERSFEKALQHAYSLFKDYTFRKVLPNDERRRRVNKSLFVAISVILAKDGTKYHRDINLVENFANMLAQDSNLFNAITWSTTSAANVEYTMMQIKTFFDHNIVQQ